MRTGESSQNSITCLLSLRADEIVVILPLLFQAAVSAAKLLSGGEGVCGGVRLRHRVKSQCT